MQKHPPAFPPVQAAFDRLQKLSAVLPLHFYHGAEHVGRIAAELAKDGVVLKGALRRINQTGSPIADMERYVTWREISFAEIDPLWKNLEDIISGLKGAVPCK